MNIVIDIGNSRTKVAVMDEGRVVERWSLAVAECGFLEEVLKKYNNIGRGIVCSTGGPAGPVAQWLRERIPYAVCMGPATRMPLKILYATPHSLGADRVAAAVGAGRLYPNENLMIADMGTAITVDFVSKEGEFLGGSISPGVRLRFEALHNHTANLPMGSPEDAVETIANTTAQALANGVVNGIIYELEGYAAEYSIKMEGLKVILTGGDAYFFAKRFKNTIFAVCDPVVIGLNTILDYNAAEHENI